MKPLNPSCAYTAPQSSICQRQRRIVERFKALDELERFDYLMTASFTVGDEYDDDQLGSKHHIPGCQAGLWVRAKWRDGKLFIAAGSDAMLVTALANLIISVVKGCSSKEIAGADINFFLAPCFERILFKETAASLKKMVDYIKAGAASVR